MNSSASTSCFESNSDTGFLLWPPFSPQWPNIEVCLTLNSRNEEPVRSRSTFRRYAANNPSTVAPRLGDVRESSQNRRAPIRLARPASRSPIHVNAPKVVWQRRRTVVVQRTVEFCCHNSLGGSIPKVSENALFLIGENRRGHCNSRKPQHGATSPVAGCALVGQNRCSHQPSKD